MQNTTRISAFTDASRHAKNDAAMPRSRIAASRGVPSWISTPTSGVELSRTSGGAFATARACTGTAAR